MEYGQISNIQYPISNIQPAFTVIELLTVIFIMGLMATLILANVNGQRDSRNINLAQSQLISNIRKIQNYTLSARNLNGQAVQYYVMKFDMSAPDRYTILAMENVSTAPVVLTAETDILPQGIVISGASPISINFDNFNKAITQSCALLSFGAPFAQALMNDGCATSPPNASFPYSVTTDSSDDYEKIVTFVANNPAASLHSDAIMNINLVAQDNAALAKGVVVNGITGLVSSQ